MFVYNACVSDVRVFREASALARAGHRVVVFAVLDKHTSLREERDGFTIIRIDRNPIHYRLLRAERRLRRRARLALARAKRRLQLVRIRSRRRARRIGNRCRRYVRRAWRRSRVPWLWRRSGVPWYLRRLGITGRSPSPDQESAADGARDRPLGMVARGLAATVGLPVLGLRLVARGLRAVARWLDGLPRRTLLRVHKPLMFTDYYLQGFRAARELGASVFHAHDVNTLPVAAWLARRTGGRLVYDAHELYTEMSTLSKRERRIWRIIERRLIRRADVVVTVCESIAGELSDRYGVARPSVLLNVPASQNGLVPRSTGALRRKLGHLTADRPIVLYQGGFTRHRGLANLIAAGGLLSDCVIVLMGSGPLENALRAQILASGLERNVQVIGAVPYAELLEHTREATVGVIPYEFVGLNNYYSTPNKLFEYIAAGIPIVASDFPELRRVLRTYDVGVTFDPTRPADIARAIDEVLGDPTALSERRSNALRAAESLNWETEQLKLLGLYRELSARGRQNA